MFPILMQFAEAVEAVEKVATHINEMQRITEKFASLFNQIVEEFGGFEVIIKSF